jgi:hypothetical protein
LSAAGESVTSAMPVPLRLTVCGLLLALSVMVTAPLSAPVAVGVNVTEITHFFPGKTELPQVLISAKGALATMLLIVSVAVPVLVRLTFFAAVVLPTATLPKLRDVGESVTVCAMAAAVSNRIPTPVRVTVLKNRKETSRCNIHCPIVIVNIPGGIAFVAQEKGRTIITPIAGSR